ncbi:MAG TPA: penicillin-binding protein 2 [Chloroflexota bacterium]|nr:penicillin-binding protein 2 [Chloroflexota bacterium]
MQLLRSLENATPPPVQLHSRRRILEVGAVGALGMLALGARLFQLQVLEGAAQRVKADNNRLRVVSVPAQRGLIYDRNGIAMVRNRPSFTVSILPADLPSRPEVVYRRLAKLIGGSAEAFARAVARRRGDPFTPVPLQQTTDTAAAQAIEERHLELPGVVVAAEPLREYPDGPLTSHVLGHLGQITEDEFKASGGAHGPYTPLDRVGQNGVESTFEAELRGVPGEKQAEVDATGREVGIIALDPPRAGRNVQLTIDLALQREVYRILSEKLDQFEVASAIALDPNSGQILAMVHLPSYDNSLFSPSIGEDEFARLMADENRPMLNGCVASAWPPGSCFKMITALAALQTGVVKPDTVVDCRGGIRLPNGASRACWASHGPQDVISALANSCDTYFYSLGGGEASGKWPGLGGQRIAEWAQQLGFGKLTGIELPGEVPGLTPTPAWKKATQGEPWYVADDWFSAIGQGYYLVTPIQMAMLTATVANGGTLFKPQLALALTDQRGSTIQKFDPKPVGKIPVADELIGYVREGVRAGMLVQGTSPWGHKYTGTSWDSNIKEIAIAGKTSTAEYGTRDAQGKLATHGWFSFWAPHDQPKLAGTVFTKKGGGKDTAKLGRDIVKAYFGIV